METSSAYVNDQWLPETGNSQKMRIQMHLDPSQVVNIYTDRITSKISDDAKPYHFQSKNLVKIEH